MQKHAPLAKEGVIARKNTHHLNSLGTAEIDRLQRGVVAYSIGKGRHGLWWKVDVGKVKQLNRLREAFERFAKLGERAA